MTDKVTIELTKAEINRIKACLNIGISWYNQREYHYCMRQTLARKCEDAKNEAVAIHIKLNSKLSEIN